MKKLLLSSILLLSSALTLMAQFAVNTTSATICAGSCATITAAPGGGMGPYTYSWNPAATGPIVSVCPTVTTTYTVFVTDMMGGTGSAVATVTVNPPPTPTITGITNVCNGSSTTLTANAGGSYLWNTGANTAIITVAPATTTTYTVTVTTNGCTGSASIQVTVCTGIKEQTSANGSIKVYPNPFMDNTTFTFQSDKQNE